jgi:hypothetical protein
MKSDRIQRKKELMKKWLGEFLNKIRFNKTTKADIIVQNIARDKFGRWVSDNEGKLVYKNDTPERIAKFTKAQEDKYAKLEEQLKSKCCQGSGVNCHCSPEKLAEKKKQAEAPKPKPFPKPTVTKPTEETKKPATPKKKSTGGGSTKAHEIQ